MNRRALLLLTSAALLFGAACEPLDSGRPDFVAAAYLRLVAAEDARPAGGKDLETLIAGTVSPSATLRAVAVRALGRLENPDLVPAIARLTADHSPPVRREAANALAQAVHRGDGGAALEILVPWSRTEHDPTVLGAIARSVGRLRLAGPEHRDAARTLVSLSRGHDGDAPPYQMEGVALGLASHVRRLGGQAPLPSVSARLEELSRYGLSAPSGDEGAARTRAAAVSAFAARGLTAGRIRALMADPAQEVRRLAVARLSRLPEDERIPLVDAAMGDEVAQVRLEAVRAGLGAAPLSDAACVRLLATAGSDPATQVRLAALDALASPCPDRATQIASLAAWTGQLDGASADWHVGGHALAALAAIDSGRAGPLVARYVAHTNLFARMWVATAAARIGDVASLQTLAMDPEPNVRTEAVRGLAGVQGRAADPLLLDVLAEAQDNQLLLTLAGLLEDTDAGAPAVGAALDALERISESRLETLRDARVALLGLVEAVGDSTFVGRVEGYLRDYDPAVALRAAEALAAWTGKRWIDAPRGSPRLAVPTVDELHAMEGATLVLHMARGGDIQIRLHPWLAPTNALRFYRLAMDGTFAGLTFHRVVPNFVIQGGSPGANEYAGHGAFSRDEVSLLPNWRGTVGLSTRGRDTGDGQMYVNLVHNIRLDHDYTIYGSVVAGMDVVDAVLEGDVIEGVEVRHPGA